MPLVVPYVKLPQLRTFPRPTGLRQTHNTQQHASTGERYVYSEAEFRSAIGEVVARFSSDAGKYSMPPGGDIVVAGTFTVSSTIVIPQLAPRIRIRSIGGAVIVPAEPDQGTLFEVRSIFARISDLFVFYKTDDDGTPTAWFNTFVEMVDGGPVGDYNVNPFGCHVVRNVFYGDRLYVDSSLGVADNAIIAENFAGEEANGAHAACVVIDSQRVVCSNNSLSDGGGDAITLSANAEYCSVSGNDCRLGDITSSASVGSNVINGNMRTGTITRHVTDAVDNNT